MSHQLGDHKEQSIAKKRPSGFVILSAAKDLSPDRSFAALRACSERSEGMTLLKRLRLTRKTSSLQWIVPCGRPYYAATDRPAKIVHSRGDPLWSPSRIAPFVSFASRVLHRPRLTQNPCELPQAVRSQEERDLISYKSSYLCEEA